MARPNKTGLDYFPLDVDFHDDDKVALLTAEFNVMAEAIIIRLLCKIYKNGYYYAWGDDERLLFCRWAGGVFVPNQVEEVVKGCLRRSFFDKGVFEAFGVLTSPGIQKRFLQASQGRKSIDIIADYWLLDIPSDDRFNIIRLNNGVNPPNNGVNPLNNGVNPPKKYIKKSKVNISTTTTTAREDLDDPEDSVNDFSATPEKGCAEKVPPQVPPGTYSLVPIGQVAEWMKSETVWLEAFCINNHKDPKYIKRKIDEFARECESRGDTVKDKGDCKRHFYNWLRKVEQQPNNNYTNGKRTYSKTEPPSADELDRAIAEGFARAHTRQEWEQ